MDTISDNEMTFSYFVYLLLLFPPHSEIVLLWSVFLKLSAYKVVSKDKIAFLIDSDDHHGFPNGGIGRSLASSGQGLFNLNSEIEILSK